MWLCQWAVIPNFIIVLTFKPILVISTISNLRSRATHPIWPYANKTQPDLGYTIAIKSRVKGRPCGHPLLIKPYVRISRIRLSFGLSHCRRWILNVMNLEKQNPFSLIQLSPSVLIFSSCSTIFIYFIQIAFLPTLFRELLFWHFFFI